MQNFGRTVQARDIQIGTVIAEAHCGIRHTITAAERAYSAAGWDQRLTLTPLDNPTVNGQPIREPQMTTWADALMDDPEEDVKSNWVTVTGRYATMPSSDWYRDVVSQGR